MKKLIALALAAMMLLSLAACGGAPAPAGNDAAADSWTIGICQWVQHPALDSATEGFKAAVIDGLGESNVTFMDENANNEAATCTQIRSVKKLTIKATNAPPANHSDINDTVAASTTMNTIMAMSQITEIMFASSFLLWIESFRLSEAG